MTKTTKSIPTPLNQNELVIKFLRRNSRRKLTSEQVTDAVNKEITEKYGPRKKLTITQVSKCLNRFSVKNMVKKADTYGKTSIGRKTNHWTYVKV